MKAYRCKGSITVFLSLISVLLLSLLCTLLESSRMQGARAKAAAALDMGVFSLFGEFENELLESYDIFALDGASGGGFYSVGNLENKLEEYILYNTVPGTGIFFGGMDPFSVSLQNAQIEQVGLLTDEQGEAFYQQAVGFMHDNLATEAVNLWLERKQDAEKLQQAADEYKKGEQENNQSLGEFEKKRSELEKEEKNRQEQEKKNAEKNGNIYEEMKKEEEKIPRSKNPLETIKEVRKRGILGLVLGEDSEVSKKMVDSDVASKRALLKGNLAVEKKYGGIGSDLLFQEYLFQRFLNYSERQEGELVNYELEYILCGKDSDEKNLKEVIKRLLVLREGANFIFLCSDSARTAQAQEFAEILVGAVPIPGFSVVAAYALMLVWAYAESVLDVRILMNGGKVAVWKTGEDWQLDLTDIPDILKILTKKSKGNENGLSYEDYLQILYTVGRKGKYPLLALDICERKVQRTGNAGFRADHGIVKMKTKAVYSIPPVFLRVTNAFMQTGTYTTDYQATGTFAY